MYRCFMVSYRATTTPCCSEIARCVAVGIAAFIVTLGADRSAWAKPQVRIKDTDHPIVQAKQAFDLRDQRALQKAQQALAKDPLLVWADYWAARVSVTKDPFASSSQALIASFESTYKTHPLVRALQRDWGLAALDRGPWPSAASVIADIPADLDAPGIQCARARLSGTLTKAQSMELIAGAELSAGCLLLLEDLAQRRQLQSEDIRSRARWAAIQGEVASAERVYSIVGAKPDGHERELLKLLSDARIQSARALGSLERLAPSLSGEQLAFARMAVGARLWGRSDERAWQLTQQGISSRQDQPGVILETAARLALHHNDVKTLGMVIKAMPERLQADDTWLYWKGWVLSHEGKRSEAQSTWAKIPPGWSFYQQLAAEALKRPTVPAPLSSEQLAEIAKQKAALTHDESARRAFKLGQLGLRVEAGIEWSGLLKDRSDEFLLAASEVAQASKQHDRAITAAGRTQRAHSLAHRYPPLYRESVEGLTAGSGVSPAWVLGLIRQESRFMEKLKSPVGASGLMQLMPKTAKSLAKRVGLKKVDAATLEDPASNLKMGVLYLKDLHADFQGSSVLATAAYNAGPSRSRLWQSTLTEPISGAAFAESIPFSETRDYVKKVLANASAYQSSLGAGTMRVGLDQPARPLSDWLSTIQPGANRAKQSRRS